MSPHDPTPPPDPERLLGARLRDTTPAFEHRWTDLKRRLRTEPASRSSASARSGWWSLVALGAALAAVLLVLRPLHPGARSLSTAEAAAYGELLALDDSLRAALPLADAATAEALLLLPLQSGGSS